MKVLAWPLLNCTNSFTEQLYGALIEAGIKVEQISVKKVFLNSHDIFHIHWPDYQLSFRRPEVAATRVLLLFLLLLFVQLRGAKVVWTAHNIQSHQRWHPRLESLFWRMLPKLLDGVIYLSDASREEAIRRHRKLSELPYATIAHGHYCAMNAQLCSKLEARDRLCIPREAVVATCFGMVRRSKNVPHVVERFRDIGNESYRLVIVGQPDDRELREELLAAIGHDRRILTNLDFIDEDEAALWLNATDFCVINYSSILNSGSALLSLSFRRPVFASNLPHFAHLKRYFGSDWIRTFSDGLPVAEFETAFHWSLEEKSCIDAKLEEISWPRIAEQTLRFYGQLRAASSPVRSAG